MKDQLQAIWAKAVEHKQLLIQIGATLAGAFVGAVVASAIANARNDMLLEELLMEPQETNIEVTE